MKNKNGKILIYSLVYGGIWMLCRMDLEIERKDDIYINQNISSLFHGVIMERIKKEYADAMHISNLRPYSQSIQITSEKIFWTICTVTDDAYENIIETLAKDDFNEVHLKNKNTRYKIISKKIEKISMDDFLYRYFFGNGERKLKIIFSSPCAFKTDGKYLFYPSVKHIMQSLAAKFEETQSGISVYTPELIEDMEKNISIVQYNLKSRFFHMEGVRIPSFSGEITIKINGPDQFVNLANMLIFFGEYSGIGIKCALGMGAVKAVGRSEYING